MNKNFIFGSIFGVVLGLSFGIATPMIAETVDIKLPSKKTNSAKKNSIYQELSIQSDKGGSQVDLTKVISLMKEIDSKLEKHTQQNEKMIETMSNLAKRFNPINNTPAK